MIFKNIAPDKWKHFIVGIGMGAFLQGVSYYLFWPSLLQTSLAAFIAVVVISYGFELFSLITRKGHYEIMDAVAAIIGGLIGMGVVLLAQW